MKLTDIIPKTAFGWVVTHNTKDKDYPYIELRKKYSNGNSIFLIVSSGEGYNYKFYKVDSPGPSGSTKGVNIHMSLNGPAQLIWLEFAELNEIVQNARKFLTLNCDFSE